MTRRALPRPGSVRAIAVFRALFLGDLLCSTPALRALRHRFPGARIDLIGLPWAAELVERLPAVDRLVTFPGYPGIEEVPVEPERTSAFLDWARAERYDIALQMHGSGAISNGFVAELGARYSVGYAQGADDRLTRALPWDPDEHETRRWLRLVAALGAEDDVPRLDFPVRADELRSATRLFGDLPERAGPLIALHAGAKAPERRWPPACFAALADALVARWNARIVLTGSAEERPLTAAIQAAMRVPALDLAGRTDLATFAALIAGLDLLVTNDTGASHLAAATRTPSIVLFGPTPPEHWAPLDRARHRVVDAPRLLGLPDRAAALAQLPVAMVLDACAAQLADPARERRHVPILERSVNAQA